MTTILSTYGNNTKRASVPQFNHTTGVHTGKFGGGHLSYIHLQCFPERPCTGPWTGSWGPRSLWCLGTYGQVCLQNQQACQPLAAWNKIHKNLSMLRMLIFSLLHIFYKGTKISWIWMNFQRTTNYLNCKRIKIKFLGNYNNNVFLYHFFFM